ncbi:hypothetical protein [Streptomyces sp. NPDC047841]|uniref:hypothetical protein n=1 Tax=Streptomyces sp. NPDC047841 TaxID=3154708 RepID=UPI00345636C8
MFSPKARVRSAAVAAAVTAALIGFNTGAAHAAGWPPLQEGAYLYSGPDGTGTVTTVDLNDIGTCHTLSKPALSTQVVSGSAAVLLYSGPDCTARYPWGTGSLAQQNLPWAMLSYRVVSA